MIPVASPGPALAVTSAESPWSVLEVMPVASPRLVLEVIPVESPGPALEVTSVESPWSVLEVTPEASKCLPGWQHSADLFNPVISVELSA
ncbi:hypothetical protein ALQ91_200230 [Pseudomonas syringae pv. syringae]|nr:hypothetical protein ALQ91_200230 [Pseudomonas syringae pv. syringae]